MSADQNNVAAFSQRTHPNPALSQSDIDTIIKSCNFAALSHLQKLITDMFDNVNIFLLQNISNKKNINTPQQSYLEELHALDLKIEIIEETFKLELENSFDRNIKSSQKYRKSVSIKDAADLLMAAQGEQLEETIIITNLIAKGRKLYSEPLSAINKRTNSLTTNSNDTAFGPELICRALKTALDKNAVPNELRQIIYKLFDQHVVLQLDSLYHDINSIMHKAGVLPNLMSEPGIIPVTEFPETSHTSTRTNKQNNIQNKPEQDNNSNKTDKPKQANGDLYGTLQHLIMMKKHMISVSKRQKNPNQDANKHSHQIETKIKTPLTLKELLTSLTVLQQSESRKSGRDSKKILDSEYIKNFVVKQSCTQAHILSKKIGTTDEDIIELVSMLFRSIELDSNLPSSMKELILRLKLPVMKVALSDKNFFNDPGHPARVLMNKLAFSGISWNEMSNVNEDPLYKKATYIVNKISSDTQHNFGLYNELADELSYFLEKDVNSKELITEPSSKSIDTASKEIEKCLHNQEVPETVKHFMATAWKKVLSHIYSKDGSTSQTWEYTLSITRELIASTQPKITRQGQQDLLRDIPRILNGLQDGLTLISYDRAKMQTFFTELELIHMASLKGELIDIYDLSPGEREFGTEGKPDNQVYIDDPDQLIKEIETLTTRIDNKKRIDSKESDIFKDTVKKLVIGSWIEITEENNKKFRVKLAWKSEATGEYSFVDRSGHVVKDKTLAGLVTDFRDGHIHIINDTPLIDRALEDIRSQLKKFVYRRK